MCTLQDTGDESSSVQTEEGEVSGKLAILLCIHNTSVSADCLLRTCGTVCMHTMYMMVVVAVL